MPTSVHIPKMVLDKIDRRARTLKISRNRFIVRTLEKELARESEWTPGFFDELAQIEPDDAAAVEEMTASITAKRTRKRAPSL